MQKARFTGVRLMRKSSEDDTYVSFITEWLFSGVVAGSAGFLSVVAGIFTYETLDVAHAVWSSSFSYSNDSFFEYLQSDSDGKFVAGGASIAFISALMFVSNLWNAIDFAKLVISQNGTITLKQRRLFWSRVKMFQRDDLFAGYSKVLPFYFRSKQRGRHEVFLGYKQTCFILYSHLHEEEAAREVSMLSKFSGLLSLGKVRVKYAIPFFIRN